MENEKFLQKALFLFEQKRYTEAEKEFGKLLAAEPANAYNHCMLALCMLNQDKHQDANKHALEAIGLDPSEPFSFYVAANSALGLNKVEDAEKHIHTAISLNPVEADYYGLLSSIYLHKKEWQQALDTANQGLAFEADHLNCLNLRATAFVKLDKKEEAYKTIQEALYFNPEDARTHANLGWGILENGDHKKSLEHFRQALKIDPNSEYAKAGMVEALKARYWFYRIFLRYAFWIGNMKSSAQWAIIIGFYIGSKIVRVIAETVPASRIITIPLIVLYTIFALSTWIIGPLSNLFLRLNIYGRYALDKEEIKCSNIVGIVLLTSVLSGISYLITNHDFLIMACVMSFTMMILIAGTFNAAAGTRGRKILLAYTTAMLVIGLFAIMINATGGEMFNLFSTIYILGFFIFQWVGNSIAMKN